MLEYNSIYIISKLLLIMDKTEIQTKIFDFKTHQMGVDDEAHNILCAIKKQLIKKHKKNFTFSDAVKELRNRCVESNINFTAREVTQIKTQLKGGKK